MCKLWPACCLHLKSVARLALLLQIDNVSQNRAAGFNPLLRGARWHTLSALSRACPEARNLGRPDGAPLGGATLCKFCAPPCVAISHVTHLSQKPFHSSRQHIMRLLVTQGASPCTVCLSVSRDTTLVRTGMGAGAHAGVGTPAGVRVWWGRGLDEAAAQLLAQIQRGGCHSRQAGKVARSFLLHWSLQGQSHLRSGVDQAKRSCCRRRSC